VRRTLLALGTVLVLLAGCGDDEADRPFSGRVLDAPYDVPDIALTATDGASYSLAADREEPLTMVFFAYTHCPDICPAVLGSLASGLTKLDDADRERVDVVVITTDPARDTEEVMRDYLDGFDPSWEGLTGDLDTIRAVAEPLHIYVDDGEQLPSGGYDLGAHGTSVVGIDDSGRATVYWEQETSPAQFASDIHSLLNEDA
jgi:protein SCO1/2